MKKNKLVVLILLLAVIIMCSATPAKAQDKKSTTSSSSQCFNESSKLLNIGIGLGGRSYYKYNKGNGISYHQSPAFSLSYEQAVKSKLGPGYLGVGAYLGFRSERYRYEYDYWDKNGYHYGGRYYQHSWNYYILAARGAYHLDVLNWEKGEIYVGGLLGLRFHTYSYKSDNNDPDYNHTYSGSSMGLTASLFAGGRYYFTDKVGAFMELGYGISYLTLGVTIKI